MIIMANNAHKNVPTNNPTGLLHVYIFVSPCRGGSKAPLGLYIV